MNKNFIKAASLTLGLTFASLSLAGCNMGGRTNPGGEPGGVGRENTQQQGLPDGNPNRFLNNNMDLNPMDNNRMNPNARNNNGMGFNGRNNVSPTAPSPGPQEFNLMRQKSANITSQLMVMPEVDQANVLVTGNTCLVAYSPGKAQADVNARKNMVINKVKQIDPTINNVVVSESRDVMAKINQVMNDIANNKPMNEINNEVMQLMKTAAPVVS